MELLTQSEYAKRRGCSKVAVHKAVKSGRIALIDGKIDPEAADRDWQANSLPRVGNQPAPKQPAPPPTDDPIEPESDRADFQHERALRERAERKIAEMEEAKMRGELRSTEEVRREWARIASRQLEAWLQFSERMAPLLEMRPIAFIRQTLDAEVRQILNGLADGCD